MWVFFPARSIVLGLKTRSVALWALIPTLCLLSLPTSLRAAAPVVDSLIVTPSTVAPGGTVTVRVMAHDPDCGTGTCTTGCGLYIRQDLTGWTASGGAYTATRNGVSSSPYAAEADWQAPAVEGSYTLTVSISDSGSMLCGGRQTITSSTSVFVSATPNLAPQVTALTATPPAIFPGSSSALACAATDPDGDPVVYSWSADLGAVTPGTAGAATFTAPAPGLATITCTATDPNGASGSRTTRVSVSGAAASQRLSGPLAAPHRVAVDSLGNAFVVDQRLGGIQVFHLGNGQPAWLLHRPGATAVAVDWADRLLVGLRGGGAELLDRAGALLRTFPDVAGLGEVVDVAVDPAARRYAVLHRPTGRVVVFDEAGTVFSEFGSTGDAPETFKSPSGLAFTPQGRIVVADSGHALIKIFEPAGTLLSSFGGPGGGIGEFIQLGDVEVDASGVIYASDLFQGWVQTFAPDGTPREAIGTWGPEAGHFRTPNGLAVNGTFDRLVVTSTNTPSVEVFVIDPSAPPPPLPLGGVSPASLAFLEQAVGTTSSPQTVTVVNSGAIPLGIRSFRVQGDFSIAPACPSLLEPGASCVTAVRFAPAFPGPQSGTLTVDTSTGTPTLVSLSGPAYVLPDALPAPGLLAFGPQGVGTASAPVSVTLLNPGTVPLLISALYTTGDFAVVSSCPASLPGGGSCQVGVAFGPTAPGSRSGQLVVESNGAHSPTLVPLSGTGLGVAAGPALAFDVAALDFGTVAIGATGGPLQAGIRNTGDTAVVLGPLVLSGPDAGAFVVVDDPCSGQSLAAGATCTLTVAFRPPVAGPAAAELRMADVTGAITAVLPLSGTGEDSALREIPTVSEWGLMLLALLLAGAGLSTLRRRTA